MKQTAWHHVAFHPVPVLASSILVALIFAGFVILRFEGETRWYLLNYFTPIGIPFVTFLFDRAERYSKISLLLWGIDLSIVTLSLVRAVVLLPFISGHALFLSYSMLTMRSTLAKITALVVLVQVAYLKIFVWQDATLLGGIVIGCLAALLYKQVDK